VQIKAFMKKIKLYIKESYDELMHKVSWPTWSELQNSAIVVSIASLIIALAVYLMDITFSTLLKQFYNLF
jgi:preprotein translocase subunit SecE